MSPNDVLRWLSRADSKSVLHVSGLSLEDVRQALSACDPVLTVEAPSGTFAEVWAAFRPFLETAIARLARLDDLTVSDELETLLDHGVYNPHLGELFEKLWSARFAHLENRWTQEISDELVRSTFEVTSTPLRCDALLFWFSLMGQSYALSPGKLNLLTRESADADLTLFLQMADVWQTKGSPLRVLVLS